jgi:hypothetical protein
VHVGKAQRGDHVDGCDIEFLGGNVTPDAALPPAIGGVEGDMPRRRSTRRR